MPASAGRLERGAKLLLRLGLGVVERLQARHWLWQERAVATETA